jgi:FeS assembly SUF system protein
MAESAQPAVAPPAPSAPSESATVPANPFASDEAHVAQSQQIKDGLKKIYDPEIPMNIVDLGLIYRVEWQAEIVKVTMTLTAPGCPVAGILAEEVKTAVEKVPGVKSAVVDMVWDPPWSPDRMSEFAKRQFGYL